MSVWSNNDCDDEEMTKSTPEYPIFSAHTQTQPIDCPFSDSEENFNYEAEQSHDTLPLDSELLEGTQLVNDVYCVGTETQVVEDVDWYKDEEETPMQGGDTELAEETQVLSDRDDDVFGDGVRIEGSNAEIETKEEKLGLEKKDICSYDQEADVLLAVSNALKKDKNGSGFVLRSFKSVQTGSLRSSGIEAVLCQIPKGGERNSDKGISEAESWQKKDNTNSSYPCADVYGKENGMSSLSEPTLASTVEKDQNNVSAKLQRNIQEDDSNDNRTMIGKIRARRPFDDTEFLGNEEIAREPGSPAQESDSGHLFAVGHEITGLSYVCSQEPGEESQTNALNIVDEFLLINDVELSGEVGPEENDRVKSPPIFCAQGIQSLASRTDFHSTVGTSRIFDWIDSQEDEGGGDFFCRRKDALLGGRSNMQKVQYHPQKSEHPTSSRTESTVNLAAKNAENVNTQVHHKIMRSTLSDLRLNSRTSSENELSVPKILTRRDLFTEKEEDICMQLSKQQLETYAGVEVTQDVIDVGIDTQMAAEAMEALGSVAPMNNDVADVLVLERNIRRSSIRTATRKKQSSKRKRVCSSNSKGNTKQCKQKKELSAKFNMENSRFSCKGTERAQIQLTLDIQLKSSGVEGMSSNSKCERRPNAGKSLERNVCLNGMPSVTVKRQKIGRNSNGVHIHGVDEHLPSTSDKFESFGVLNRTVTPVACISEQSVTRNSMEVSENLLNDPIESVRDQGRCAKSLPLQIGKFRKKKIRQEIQGTKILKKVAQNTYDVTNNSFNHPKGRRTSRILDHSINVGEPGRIPKSGHLAMGSAHLPKVSKLSAGDGIVPPEDQRAVTPTQRALEVWNCDADYSRPLGECVEGNETVGQSKEMNKASGTASATTPSKELCAVSPICKDANNTAQSSKKSAVRSALIRELISLGPPVPAPEWKNSRRRRDMASVSVLFSHHLDEDIVKKQKKILARLEVPVASSMSNATHFIADKFARTRNMLEAIALGKPVVTHLWLESCGQASCFIDEKNYILRDFEKEKEIGFSMPVSLARACSNPLLQGKRVFITSNVKPDRELISSLVKAAQGQAVERLGRYAMKGVKYPSDILVISCEEDYAECVPLLEKGANIYSTELLLNGIVVEKLEYDRHCIFIDHVKRTRNEEGNRWCRN